MGSGPQNSVSSFAGFQRAGLELSSPVIFVIGEALRYVISSVRSSDRLCLASTVTLPTHFVLGSRVQKSDLEFSGLGLL